MRYHKIIGGLSMLAVISFATFSCSDDEDSGMNPTPASEKAKVRAVHTSYDAPAVDILVDGAVAVSSLEYGESSGYAEVNAGTRNVKVTASGTTSPAVIEANLPVESGKEYTVFAVNALTSIEAIVAVDARVPNTNKVKIRLVHTSPDAPAVDVKLNSGGGPTVFSNLAFKGISDYLEVDGGSYTFVITPAGSATEVVKFDPVPVSNGQVLTVVAHGTLDANDTYPFAVRVFVDNDPGNAFVDLAPSTPKSKVMVVHASPDAPGVDLLLDGAKVNTAPLEFPNSTGYLQVDAGDRNVKVNVAGTSTTVIDVTLNYAADQSYTVFAVDKVADISAIRLEDDLAAPAPGNAHVRFVHLSPDAPAVDITLTDGTVVFGNKAFKEFTSFTPLPAGSYDLQVRLAGGSTVVLDLPGITLQDGKIYTIFAKGFAGGTGSQPLGAEIIVNN